MFSLVLLPACSQQLLGGEEPDNGDAGPKRCPDSPCAPDALCIAGACVPTEGRCMTDEDCINDSFCDNGRCVPYRPGTKASDPTCRGSGFMAEKLEAPILKCQWTRSPVISTPIVADLDGDKKPEIIFVTFDGGKLAAIHGADCSELFVVPAGLGNVTQVAVADLDGDKVPEIVGIDPSGYVKVFSSQGTLLATSTGPAPAGPAGFIDGGPAIANLDGMGPPEIVYAGTALRFEGGKLTTLFSVSINGGWWGALSAVADVDLDGKPDIVVGNRILDGMTGADKTPEPARSFLPGYVAIAQFDPSTPEPEIVLISSDMFLQGTLRIYHPKTGQVVFGPYTFGMKWGGPPTVGDFDGDGKPEVALAGYEGYAVFDPDCAADPLPAFCQAKGMRWLKTTQDYSSGSTGSSVFDFNGDGQAEAIYRDECWLRVYDGKTGQIKFAQSLTSGTILEMPIVADVDDDGHADLIVPTHKVEGCAAEAELHLPAGPSTQGIQVLVDPKNRWMPSRGIWNQHTYHITNIYDDATVPAVELNNWTSWNNYRQNVQGLIKGDEPAPDVTAGRPGSPDSSADCMKLWTLSANICNRGASNAPSGVPGTFYIGDPRKGGAKICTARTKKELAPGSCEQVRCDDPSPPAGPVDLWFAADDNGSMMGTEVECKERNNLLHIPDAACMVIG